MNNQSPIIRVLLIEDNPGDAGLIREMLSESRDIRFDLKYAERLSTGLEYLTKGDIDILLLDLSLPDSTGYETFVQTRSKISWVPIILLTGLVDESLAFRAVQEGAQDYLVKGNVDSNLLIRVIRYAIERKRVDEELRKYQDYLEKRVEERTASLVLSNKQLQQEIVERRRAEEAIKLAYAELDLIFNAAAEGMCIIDKEFKIIRANETMCALFGKNKEQLLNKNFFEALHRSLDNICPLERIFQGEERIECDLDLELHDGQIIPCILTAVPFRGLDSEIIGIMVSVKDISLHKKIGEELQRVQKLESVGLLAGGIAHDYNNILTAISGSFSLAKLYLKPGDKVLEIIDKAEKAARRARDLTKQLLTFAKGGAPVKKVVPIKELLEHIVTFSLSGSKSRCELLLAEDLWASEIDEGQISQVINNLLINAVQAMPQGGVIKLEAENTEITGKEGLPLQEGGYVKISVRDQGIGIPEEHLFKIFDPYFTTKEKGSGLGLSIAYSIIKSHGGHITAESHPGIGTTFFIYLPASEMEIQPQKEVEKKLPGGEVKVLFMDDEEAVREVTGQMLESLGFEVVFATDGDEAIGLYKKEKDSGHPFKVAILDLTIPGGRGGKETIQKLHEIDPEVKAIVTSGYCNDPVMADFRNYGFLGVLEKPFNLEGLSETLYKVVESDRK